MTYAFVIERGPKCVWAQAPDLAGCVAVEETKGKVRGLIREAIDLLIEALEEDGLAVAGP